MHAEVTEDRRIKIVHVREHVKVGDDGVSYLSFRPHEARALARGINDALEKIQEHCCLEECKARLKAEGKRPENYQFLKLGDKFKTGDEYGVGFCFVIGSKQTSLKEGDTVHREVMCYCPRRKVKEGPPWIPF